MIDRYNNLRNQGGAASLIAITLASLVILVLVLAMTSLMAGELHQAVDAENSVKAYYRAESNAELAVTKVQNALQSPGVLDTTLDGSCPAPTGVAESPTACSLISHATKWHTFAPLEKAKSIDLSNISGLTQLFFQWSGEPDTLVELVATSFQIDGGHNAINTHVSSLFFCTEDSPARSGSSPCGTTTAASSSAHFSWDGSVVEPIRMCGNGVCRQVQIDSPTFPGAGYYTILKVVPHGHSGQFTLRAFGNTPADFQTLEFPDAQIDVTAKNGDSYSRLTEEVPIRAGAAPLGHVLFGDTELCKNFQVLIGAGNAVESAQPNNLGTPCTETPVP